MPSPMGEVDVVSSVDVLVVGGGFAGVTAARKLSRNGAQVLLVDAKSYFEYTPAALRCIVRPSAIVRSTALHRSRSPSLHFVHGNVVDIQYGHAVISRHGKSQASENEVVDFKVCVWAGGTHYVPPIRPNSAMSHKSPLGREHELSSTLQDMLNARKYALELLSRSFILPQKSNPCQLTYTEFLSSFSKI
jgi:choline dehydrogenase-like flavoprotein